MYTIILSDMNGDMDTDTRIKIDIAKAKAIDINMDTHLTYRRHI